MLILPGKTLAEGEAKGYLSSPPQSQEEVIQMQDCS